MRKITSAVLILLTTILISLQSFACSSFMLKSEGTQIYGHNLNMNKHIPGLIFINKRDVQKSGKTWAQITNPDAGDTSSLCWTSKYGSVTFNSFGRDLPDGGMNEEGLFIWEMTGVSSFDEEENRPRLFMAQWMQYQLDNFKSVDEVLNGLSAVGLDGWNWHFFVADKAGNAASIEYISGKAVVNTKDNMPIPLMGNGRYSEDLTMIKEFEGFGGSIPLDVENPHLPGFVKAAKMIEGYAGQDAVEYGFDVLKKLSRKAVWSVIFDVNNEMVYFKTALRKEIKSFSIKSFDFSAADPVKIFDIQTHEIVGDVTAMFKDFSGEENLELTRKICEIIHDEEVAVTKEILAERFANVYKADNCFTPNIEGEWLGYAMYPTTGEPAKVDWKISIKKTDGKLTGKVTDSAGLLKDTEMHNLAFENGIVSFSVCTRGYLFKISASISDNQIKGIFDISNESRKGSFNLTHN